MKMAYTDSVCALIDLAEVLMMQQVSSHDKTKWQTGTTCHTGLPDSILNHSFDLFHPNLFLTVEKRSIHGNHFNMDTPLNFLAYPNPCSNRITIQFEKIKNKKVQIEILSINNILIYNQQHLVDNNGYIRIQLPYQIINGIYCLVAKKNYELQTKKITIIKF